MVILTSSGLDGGATADAEPAPAGQAKRPGERIGVVAGELLDKVLDD